MTPRRLVDAHLHVFDPGPLTYPWLADVPAIDAPHVPADIETALDPLFVVVQADALPEQGLAEARWVESLADGAHPQVAATVAFAPLEQGSAVAGYLRALKELPRVRGVRRLLQDEEPGFFASPALLDGLAEVHRSGLTFDACVRWWQLPALADLLARLPGLPVVLDHLGKPPVTQGIGSADGQAWLDGVTRLATLPQAHVKISGLPPEATDPAAGTATLTPWIRAVVDAFGVERAMVGSDWPVSRDQPLGLSYDGWFATVVDALDLSDAERDRLLAGTALEFYRIG